jgi:RHS repeat-associated protein
MSLPYLRTKYGSNSLSVSPANESYQSDALDRLTQLTDANGATEQAFSYNLTGDRLSKTVAGQATSNYGYQSGTHQLTLVGNAPRTVDADGNTTSMLTPNGTQVQLIYDDRNLLTQVLSSGSPIADYQYNGQGIRVWRTITAPSTGQAATVYDPLGTGNLYGEYFAADYREYVYLNGIPVASAMDAGLQAPGISYLHADGLGSVRIATTTTGADTDQWPWLDNAFGDKAMTGASGYYLRFPGQYYDVETGLHYNGHRYYDPSAGRYIQSDPIGLKGGINTYAYVGNSPYVGVDPIGLACPADLKAAGQCIDASNYDPNRDGHRDVLGTPMTDQVFLKNASSLDVSYEDENYAYITRDGGFVDASGVGRVTSKAYEGSFNIDPSVTVAICHSHPLGKRYWPTPGYGDNSAVEAGYPNYIVRDRVAGVVEINDGQYQYRILRGRLTGAQQRATQRQLNAYQHP